MHVPHPIPLVRFAALFLGMSLIAAGCRRDQSPAPVRPAVYPMPVQPAVEPYPAPNLVSLPMRTPGFGSAVPRSAAPAITARAAIVIHANTGEVLYSRNADVRYPVASTQKLLTALILAESGNLSKSVRVVASDTYVEPTKLGLRAGEVYRKDVLLRALLVRSCNDVARCLARDHAGSEAAFAHLMNQKAASLGMTNSHFQNASGLPASQYSTARDISILATAAMRNSFVRQSVALRSTTVPTSSGTTVLRTTNKLLERCSFCTGMKTGTTNAAGRCLVSSGSHGGKNVIVVLLGSKTPHVWDESEALLRWGLGL